MWHHHPAVVNVQAGVAGHVLRTDPDAAETSLATVRQAAATAVDELGRLLSVLRAGDTHTRASDTDGRAGQAAGRAEEAAGGPVEPTPDLAAIDDLISSFAASGLHVERQTSGAPRPLPPSAQLAAYRMVQEALTNAHKHGDGQASVTQRFDDTGLEVIVANRISPSASTGDGRGYGLVGMRERVEAVGGELTIDEGPERFTLRATFPCGRAG